MWWHQGVKQALSTVRLEAVGKRYGLRRPWIVRDVTAEVAPGQLILIVVTPCR